MAHTIPTLVLHIPPPILHISNAIYMLSEIRRPSVNASCRGFKTHELVGALYDAWGPFASQGFIVVDINLRSARCCHGRGRFTSGCGRFTDVVDSQM